MLSLIGTSKKVHNLGSVTLINVMGDDRSVVDAARISYGRHNEQRDAESDRVLLRYLMRHHHTSPFEQIEMQFLVRCPMDVWRQWIRHRTASVNEYSTRYTTAIDEAVVTAPWSWRKQSSTNKQGSDSNLDEESGKFLSSRERQLHDLARKVYDERINLGVAREQARKDLPLSTFTEAYWKIDGHNLMHFLWLRMDSHAQYEIREFAKTIFNYFFMECFPLVSEAFIDYRLNAITFTGPEIDLLRGICTVEENFGDLYKEVGMSEREHKEFLEKLKTLAG